MASGAHLLHAGHSLFTAGRFAEAHDAWEAACRVAMGDERLVLQALVLWAAASERARRGDLGAAQRLVTSALGHLGGLEWRSPQLEALHDALCASWERLADGQPAPAPWSPDPPGDPGRVALALEHRLACPSCGERVDVTLDLESAGGAEYVEDCPVCCRSYTVQVRAGDDGQVRVALSRPG